MVTDFKPGELAITLVMVGALPDLGTVVCANIEIATLQRFTCYTGVKGFSLLELDREGQRRRFVGVDSKVPHSTFTAIAALPLWSRHDQMSLRDTQAYVG